MKDFLLDDNGELRIENGDFVVGESDNQHQQDIIKCSKGEFREFPELGVGIEQSLGDDDFITTLIEVKKNLEYDGMKINNVTLNDGQITIDGQYKQQ